MTAMAPPSGAGYRLHVETPSALAVSVVMAPQQSVLSLLLQAASGRSLGAPAAVAAKILRLFMP